MSFLNDDGEYQSMIGYLIRDYRVIEKLEKELAETKEKLRIAVDIVHTIKDVQNTNVKDWIDIMLEEIDKVGI